jgi:hypothetical protein
VIKELGDKSLNVLQESSRQRSATKVPRSLKWEKGQAHPELRTYHIQGVASAPHVQNLSLNTRKAQTNPDSEALNKVTHQCSSKVSGHERQRKTNSSSLEDTGGTRGLSVKGSFVCFLVLHHNECLPKHYSVIT